MTTDFTITAIPPDVLTELRDRDDAVNPPEEHVDSDQPLRCCLRRSGTEQILLVAYAPLRRWARDTGADPGPYLELGPVFIHATDCGGPDASAVPEPMLGRRRVCRAYDADGRILGGELVEPCTPASMRDTLARLFSDGRTSLVHVRAVEFGCFQFAAHRS